MDEQAFKLLTDRLDSIEKKIDNLESVVVGLKIKFGAIAMLFGTLGSKIINLFHL